jgi:CheY-like chemotaxis protein
MANILVVDENQQRLRGVQHALTPHKLVCTSHVERAILALKTRNFDLLIAPIYLNSGDIFTLVRTASEIARDVRPVLLSVDPAETAKYATPSIQTAARFLGVYRYLLLNAPDTVTLRKELEGCLPAHALAVLSHDTGTIYEI